MIRMLNATEAILANSRAYVAGSPPTLSTANKHALVFLFEYKSFNDDGIPLLEPVERVAYNPTTGNPEPCGTTMYTPSAEVIEEEPPYGTETSQPLPNGKVYVHVAHPAEVGAILNSEGQGFEGWESRLSANTGYYMINGISTKVHEPGIRVDLRPGEHLAVHWTPNQSGAIPGGELIMAVEAYRPAYGQNPAQSTFQEVEYTITKEECSDASVTTRRGYGDPAIYSGDLPPDPNVGLRNFAFGAWTYKGGLFVGHMDRAETSDRSGAARVQLTTGAEHEFLRLATLSILDMGRPPDVEAPITVGAYPYPDEEPNADVEESEMRWTNKWDLDLGSPRLQFQFSGVQSVGKFVSWNLTRVFVTCTETPEGANQRVSLALPDEEDRLAGMMDSVWRYFASKEYVNTPGATGLPFADCRPRIWVVTCPYANPTSTIVWV